MSIIGRRAGALVLSGLILLSLDAAAGAGNRAKPQIVGRVVGLGACATGTPEDPCPRRPLFAVRVIVRDDADERVARRRTRVDGRFAFRVPPGEYTVEARAVPGFTAGGPRAVTVTEDQAEPQRAPLYLIATNGPGVVGQATQSPTCPGPQHEGQQCVAPLEGASIHIEDESDEIVATFVTGRNGYYAFQLAPGTYELVAEGTDNAFPSPPPAVTFTVHSDDTGPHHIDCNYDTGIR